ncbi:DUF2334 domain-containing protein [Methylacidiphilum sp. Yel]|uniref:DUF2334 domain-containing protein n=1 Tax=Methylacidiphilum sp. Yel TaxID=1847730 RepID=UPI00106BE4B3|nr:polysaccharide deacetylase family protein [Methylacidiphilum sp. Yel]TFE69100.1 DUF2334 domain-containing protein [Methylacidiphilum sp. Yel]
MAENLLFVTLHDVHPMNRKKIEKQRESLSAWGIEKVGLLIVPFYHHKKSIIEDPSFCAWISSCASLGDEPIVHGFYHDRIGRTDKLSELFWTRIYTQQEAEFLGIEKKVAFRRLEEAKKMFMSLGWSSRGFIAPGWLFDAPLLEWLPEVGYAYTVAIDRIILFENPSTSSIFSFSHCWSNRSAWRRAASIVWNSWLKQRNILSKKRYVRVGLHPEDSDYPAIWKQVEKSIKDFLELGMHPETYGSLVKS